MTAEQLRDIGLRRDAQDIIPLLWEIKRLRALVLRADQITRTNTSSAFLVDIFKEELRGEPAIEEQERRNAPHKASDSLAPHSRPAD